MPITKANLQVAQGQLDSSGNNDKAAVIKKILDGLSSRDETDALSFGEAANISRILLEWYSNPMPKTSKSSVLMKVIIGLLCDHLGVDRGKLSPLLKDDSEALVMMVRLYNLIASYCENGDYAGEKPDVILTELRKKLIDLSAKLKVAKLSISQSLSALYNFLTYEKVEAPMLRLSCGGIGALFEFKEEYFATEEDSRGIYLSIERRTQLSCKLCEFAVRIPAVRRSRFGDGFAGVGVPLTRQGGEEMPSAAQPNPVTSVAFGRHTEVGGEVTLPGAADVGEDPDPSDGTPTYLCFALDLY